MTSFRGLSSWAKMTSPGGKITALACHPTRRVNKAGEQTCLSHGDKTRVQMPARMFPLLKLLCWLFMGSTLVFVTKQRNSFLIKFGVFYNKNKILTILFIGNYEKITL
jgi:hypothetical protein